MELGVKARLQTPALPYLVVLIAERHNVELGNSVHGTNGSFRNGKGDFVIKCFGVGQQNICQRFDKLVFATAKRLLIARLGAIV